MQLSVFGATGGTGTALVEQALARGHRVRALARDRAAITTSHDRLEVVQGDARDLTAARAAVEGSEAVVSALGSGRGPTDVYSKGTGTIVEAMRESGARRLVAVSSTVLLPRDETPLLARVLVYRILRRVYGELYADMERMEALLARSDLDWTVVRPPRLVDGSGAGEYRLDAAHPRRSSTTLARADLARAMLDLAASGASVREKVTVAPA